MIDYLLNMISFNQKSLFIHSSPYPRHQRLTQKEIALSLKHPLDPRPCHYIYNKLFQGRPFTFHMDMTFENKIN